MATVAKTPTKKPKRPTTLPGQRQLPLPIDASPLDSVKEAQVETPEGTRHSLDVSSCEQLKELTAAVRLRCTGGTAKSVGWSPEDKKKAAAAVGMTVDGMSGGGKKLYSTKSEPVKAVNAACTALRKFHESVARIQYIQEGRKEGIRLIKREDIEDYIEQMTRLRAQVHAALADMQAKRVQVLDDAQNML